VPLVDQRTESDESNSAILSARQNLIHHGSPIQVLPL
jgi:hypothetical protein